MIEITRQERDRIAASFPDVHIVRTMKQKSKRHHYYCEEAPSVMRVLRRMRNAVIEKGGLNGSGPA
jgi:hypothetical protein